MEKVRRIRRCIRTCPFYGSSMDGMECNHPYWKNKGAYAGMIISHPEGDNGLPKKCPLRKSDLVIRYTAK